MADISDNANVVTSINSKGKEVQKDKKPKQNEFANYCHQKITKIVGFKDPRKESNRNANSYSVSSSLMFENPFENTDERMEKSNKLDEGEKKTDK